VKINRIDSTAPAASPAATAPSAAADAPSTVVAASPGDRISISQASEIRTSVEEGVTMAAAERSQRLHHLTQAVQSGTYRPNASQLAAQILAEAELDARLARTMA
jgi:anti-sigma28 factor (negative regulator of flagellin synthesis)